MKRENAKGELLIIVTVCCGYKKVAWIQNLFHQIARLQILPLETWGIAGILFVKTVKPVGRHSTFHMAPVRYIIHLHIMNYIILSFLTENCGAVPHATPNVSQSVGDLYTPDVTKCMMTAKWWRIINYTQASDQRWQETKETEAQQLTQWE